MNESAPQIPEKPNKVLIVDDDAFIRKVNKVVFSTLGQIVELNSAGMDVEKVVSGIRQKLASDGITHIVLDGQYLNSGTVTQVVTVLGEELAEKKIRVLAYSGTDSIVDEFCTRFPQTPGLVKGAVDGKVLVSTLANSDPFTLEDKVI